MRQPITFTIFFLLVLTLSACASPTLPPLPTRVFTPTFTPTNTPLPVTPTLTATTTPLPSATFTLAPPTLTPTPEFPPIPRGMGALIIVNNLAQELGFDIASKFYRIPSKSKLVIFLSPGRHNYSATVPGFNGKSGTAEIREGFYHRQEWG